MNQIKDHLDKIVAGVVIVACLGLIAKTHLSERKQAVSIKEIDDALERIKGAEGRKVAVPPIPKFGTEFEASMTRLDGDLSTGLSGWKFHVQPIKRVVVPPSTDYTLVVQEVGEDQRAVADAAVKKLDDAGIVGASVYRVKGGFWARVGKYTVHADARVKPMIERIVKAGFPTPTLRLLPVPIEPPRDIEGVLALPAMKVMGVYMGKAELAALFNARDAKWSVRLLQVWRRKAGEKEWPTAPLFMLTVDGNNVKVAPPKGATGEKSGLAITELNLPPREAYEYRARAAASFPKGVKLAKGLGVKPAPKELAGSLKGPGYVTEFTAPVKIETPGVVQIQFAGELMMRRKRYGNFRLKRWMPGSSKPVSDMMHFLLGKRINISKVKRIGGGPVKVVFDSEAILVSMATETRQVWGRKRIMVRDPETGVLVPKWVKYRKPDKKVKVAVIKDVRTGKTHKLDQSGGDKGWWPKGLAVQAAPAPAPVPIPVVGPPSRRGPVNGTSPRRGPVVVPKTPKTPVTPKGTPPVEPPKTQPVTPPKPPAVGTKLPPPPPPPGTGPVTEVRDPGPLPESKDPKVLEAWEKKRAAYNEWLKGKRSSEVK